MRGGGARIGPSRQVVGFGLPVPPVAMERVGADEYMAPGFVIVIDPMPTS